MFDTHVLSIFTATSYDVYEPKLASSGHVDPTTPSSTCRHSATIDSNTYSTFHQSHDEMNAAGKTLVESSKIEPATPRPPYSQIGIHNHVSLNLHFNNQHQQQQQQQQQQTKVLSSSSTSQQTSDSKLISDRFIESIVQRFNDHQQQRTSSHPHTIEYFHQEPHVEFNAPSPPAKPMNKPCSKPPATGSTAVHVLSSRERSIAPSSNYDPPFVQPTTTEEKSTGNSSHNAARLSSAADRVLPAFHTFSELKSYLQTIGLDVELVPVSNAASDVPQQSRPVDHVPQRASTTDEQQNQQQFHARSSTNSIVPVPQQPQVVMLANHDSIPNTRSDDAKGNRSSKLSSHRTTSRPTPTAFTLSNLDSISLPPNILTEKLLEYASSTSSIRHLHLASRSVSSSSEQRRSPSKQPIVSDIANLLSVANSTKEQPIVQQVTRHTLLAPPPPPPPLPPPSSTSVPTATTTTTTTTVYHHHLPSADKVCTMVKRDLIHDDVHLHDREVEEYMNVAAAAAGNRTTKTRKTTTTASNAQTNNEAAKKSIALESGSASNSNDSNISSTSSPSSSSMHPTGTHPNNNNNHHQHQHVHSTHSISKTKTPSTLTNQDSRSICDILLMLYEQERTRSTQLQKQIEQVSRQQRSRNSSGQSHSSESQTGLETPHGPTNGTSTSTRMLSPAAWISTTTGKDKTPVHIQQTLKFDSSTSINGSPPESQDVSDSHRPVLSSHSAALSLSLSVHHRIRTRAA